MELRKTSKSKDRRWEYMTSSIDIGRASLPLHRHDHPHRFSSSPLRWLQSVYLNCGSKSASTAIRLSTLNAQNISATLLTSLLNVTTRGLIVHTYHYPSSFNPKIFINSEPSLAIDILPSKPITKWNLLNHFAGSTYAIATLDFKRDRTAYVNNLIRWQRTENTRITMRWIKWMGGCTARSESSEVSENLYQNHSESKILLFEKPDRALIDKWILFRRFLLISLVTPCWLWPSRSRLAYAKKLRSSSPTVVRRKKCIYQARLDCGGYPVGVAFRFLALNISRHCPRGFLSWRGNNASSWSGTQSRARAIAGGYTIRFEIDHRYTYEIEIRFSAMRRRVRGQAHSLNEKEYGSSIGGVIECGGTASVDGRKGHWRKLGRRGRKNHHRKMGLWSTYCRMDSRSMVHTRRRNEWAKEQRETSKSKERMWECSRLLIELCSDLAHSCYASHIPPLPSKHWITRRYWAASISGVFKPTVERGLCNALSSSTGFLAMIYEGILLLYSSTSQSESRHPDIY
ncbi:hypothetical protein BDN70DRAFT_897340 [Pholiota conissans]|uniref:Uncharacterized protein n=1 Tax=Pholiota conissans TaxID=109636 RepID=A0A9P6CXM4_9AGAR|nr:hypothetical protein BDN70DRAFT_897340 [Pholiota conissans]